MRMLSVGIVFSIACVFPANVSGNWRDPSLKQEPDSLQRTEARVYEGPALTLAAALDEVLQKNPRLIELRQQFEAAKLRPSHERFLIAPTFEAQIWQWPLTSINPADTNMYMVTVSQALPGRGKRALRVAASEKEAQLAQNQIAVEARDIIAQIKRVYAELFLTRKEIEIHLANIDLLRQFAEISTAKYSTGRISQQDVLKAVTELSHLHERLVMLDERAQVDQAQLNALLNRPPESPIGPLTEPREQVTLPSSAELQQIALAKYPELRGAELERERAEAALAVAQSDYKPDFVVGGGLMLMPYDRDAWTATFGITWPRAPWARGRLDARVAEATAEVAAARAKRQAVENQVRLAVHEAYVRAKSAADRVALIRTTVVPQSQQTLDVSRAAYQTDRVDFLALLDNQRTLLEAQLSYYRALNDIEQAMADLERTVGTDLGAANVVASLAGVERGSHKIKPIRGAQ